MQNYYDNDLKIRMELDSCVSIATKLESRKASKKITYYAIWFLSSDCAKHFRFDDYYKEIKKVDVKNGEPLGNIDNTILIDLQRMMECSKIELRN